MKRALLSIAAGLVFVSAAKADEYHLKDGTVIIGILVSYEKNVYHVKTAYGYADIQRSAIASITVSSPTKEEKVPAKPEKPRPEDTAKSDESTKAADSHEATPEKNSEVAASKANPPTVSVVNFPSPVAPAESKPGAAAPVNQVSSARGTNTVTTPNATAAAPVTAPEPAPVKEEVRGNQYINDTYGFQMYKPPDWNVIEGARAALPGSIVAMGTSDQTTYLIIGLVPASGTLQAQIAATNERLAGSFEGYDPEKIRETSIAGLPAHEYQFHGAANDKEWTGTVALIQRGGNFLTILGVTSTNTDLVQMEQNVISRTIASLQFTTP